MAVLTYVIFARDSTTSPPGAPLLGLTPAWVFLKRFADGGAVTPLPVITEIGHGQYGFPFDPAAMGGASGQIDLGASVSAPEDRYIDQVFYLSDTRTEVDILAAIGALAMAIAAIPAPVPLDVATLAATIEKALPAPQTIDTAALAKQVVAGMPPGHPPIDQAALVQAIDASMPAPAVFDYAAMAKSLAPLIAAPAPVVTVNPTPVTVAPPDLSPITASLAALGRQVTALAQSVVTIPTADQEAAAVLTALRTGLAALIAPALPPIRPPAPQPVPGLPANTRS